MDLSSPVGSIPGIGPVYVKRLAKLGIYSIEDLLYHIPFRYEDYSEISKIGQFPIGTTATIKGEVLDFLNIYTKKGRKIQVAEIYDGTGKISAIWFNQPFLQNSIKPGVKLSLSGELSWWKKQKAVYGPEYEILSDETVHTGRLVPVYPATAGISPKWLRSRINKLLKLLDEENLHDFWSKDFLEKQQLLPLKAALEQIHFPDTKESAEMARQRLAFDELTIIQLANIRHKMEWQQNQPTHKLSIDDNLLAEFFERLSFDLTSAQSKAITQIVSDLGKSFPMNRLLEGDVGSGKTVVAAAAAFAASSNNKRSVFMAPTQILAEQHYITLSRLFENKLEVSLITGSTKMDISHADIVVGTHALLHHKDFFQEVAFVVIDEQHRFGVKQRAHLVEKTQETTLAPHVLTMTATPIPRTAALTLYGELELSVLDELPKGRLPIKTWLVPKEKRDPAYEWIEKQIQEDNIQAYVVCPLIEESEAETMQQVKAAESEYKKLKKIFKNRSVALLHGKLKAKQKSEILEKFRQHKIDILVTTPVIEVGVDVPNATIMLIEAAERFGLAQLHQLRGRVGRGDKQSYCLLFTETESDKIKDRLSALTQTLSGFELAELDLRLRGPGEVLGLRQHGGSNLKIANWLDVDLIKQTKAVAQQIVDNPKKFKDFLKYVRKKQQIAN